MPEFTSYTHGTPNWVDVSTNDPAATKAFYTGLFGWEPDPTPMPDAGGYEMFLLRGKLVSALGPTQGGAPPAWSMYIASDDVDATAAAITEHGGMLFVEPMDVFEAGRMAFGADPTGAMFGVWQAKLHIGAQLANEPSTFVWNELLTPESGRLADVLHRGVRVGARGDGRRLLGPGRRQRADGGAQGGSGRDVAALGDVLRRRVDGRRRRQRCPRSVARC